jgi:hypothetical protein
VLAFLCRSELRYWYGLHLGKDDLKAYALCLLILFGIYSRYVKNIITDPDCVQVLLLEPLNVMHRFTSLNISVADS